MRLKNATGAGQGRRLAEIGTAGAVTVQLVRLWLAASDGAGRPGLGWRDGCRAARLGPAGEDALAGLMTTVSAALGADLRVATPRCPFVAADEALILRVLALLQRRRHAEADGALATRLLPAPLRLALPSAVALAVALDASGLRIALEDGGRAQLLTATAMPDRGLALLQ